MACTSSIRIRDFKKEDAPQLLVLMRSLAVFEDYIDEFKVCEQDLIRFGSGEKPAFKAFVASIDSSTLPCAMAVTYTIPWTYDLKPTLVLKELFVEPQARGRGVAAKLMKHVAKHAVAIGAPRLYWTVLPNNKRAIRFYKKLGASADMKWKTWHLQGPNLLALASIVTASGE